MKFIIPLLLMVAAPVAMGVTSTDTPATLDVVSPLSESFADGFRAGYKQANPIGICPIPPIPPIGKNSYADGYGIGYARGVIDKG